MSESILIAQITDCHLPADPQQKYRGINPHGNLKILLKKVRRLKPDLLLATGDLSEDGSKASYVALQKLIKPLGVPVLALPGNHDDAVLLAEIFPGSPTDKISISEHGPWHIIRLNSSMPGKPEGRFSEEMLAELDGFLGQYEQRPCLIVMHHQPIAIGSPWIDKYPLINPQAFLQIVDRHPDIKAVVWGHVHQVYEADRKGTAMLGSPSSAINGLPGAQKFSPDPIGSVFRWLELKSGGSLLSGIV